ncbi:MAG: 16S rRNA (guanine(527)-N(7))-methyltransferase RsmG [Candidatus Nanopelagicaceae bacterium]
MTVSRETRAQELFGQQGEKILQYADLLESEGIKRGLVGPSEAHRIWDRHIENCLPLAKLFDPNSTVLDVGSGAGLPGIVIALARPDLEVTLMEPLKRRVDFLEEVLQVLQLPLRVIHSKAERAKGVFHHVTARAVAPLPRLVDATWHLIEKGGSLLAMKGERAALEIEELPHDKRRKSMDIELKEISWQENLSRIVIIRRIS